MTTLRRAMKDGLRGDWGTLAYKVLENPRDIWALVDLYGHSDLERQGRLEAQFPHLREVATAIYNDWPSGLAYGLIRAFPGLSQLDVETDDPHRVDLVTGGERA